MGYKSLLDRAVKVFISVMIVLIVVELLKGHGLLDAVMFSVLWSFISTSIFVGVSSYQSQKGKGCMLCDDVTKRNELE